VVAARVYLDSSALVKLLITEDESAALAAYLEGAGPGITSVIAVVELRRAVARRATETADQAVELLARFELVELDRALVEAAANAGPAALRSLDAIHLASALRVGDSLAALVTYDTRLADAARAAGLTVESPT
jgi:PIN domain.